MKKTLRILALALALVTVMAVFASCGKKGDDGVKGMSESPLAIPELKADFTVPENFKIGFICLHDENSTYDKNFIDAATAAKAGYAIAYAADAKVFHSHDYTCKQQFHRNFDLGVSQGEHPEIFANVPSATEGTKMVKSTIKIFLKEKRFRLQNINIKKVKIFTIISLISTQM